MKKALFIAISALTLAGSASAAHSGAMSVNDFNLVRQGDKLLVDMNLNPSAVRMSTNREVVYTPMIVNGTDTLRMNSFSVAGKNRWFSHLRKDDTANTYRAGQIKEAIPYKYETPYQPWMESAKVEIEAQEKGCCGKDGKAIYVPVAQIDLVPRAYTPDVLYVTPKAEAVKQRTHKARAYVDFPVNKIEIYPDYRRNPQELAAILHTIDSVRQDKNLTFQSIHIKGFASPEGTYANNTRLAKGRTQTLADYVRKQYNFQRDIITTSYEPEDWAGLEEYVASDAAKRTLSNPEAILAIIKDPAYKGKDDAREAAIKKNYPKDYAWLLENIYPGLRHSDYAVNYNVRHYQTPAEIFEIMDKTPGNLSLNELFVAAQSLEPGSEKYNKCFEMAVTLAPNDPVANLNAGNAALMSGNLSAAEKYLAKAGDSAEALYAKAQLAAMQKDYDKANSLLARISGLPQAQKAENQIKDITSNKGKHFRLIDATVPNP